MIFGYVNTRGWKYLIFWVHRAAGLLLVAFILLHIYTLKKLSVPSQYSFTVRTYGTYPFTVLAWSLSIPLIFHTLNGCRLILYESFGLRNDSAMTRWVLALSGVYILVLGLLMVMGDQWVSPLFYWIAALPFSIAIMYPLARRLWSVPHALAWRLQRLTAGFLLIVAPAHMLFMHLNPNVAGDPTLVIDRLQDSFIKGVDLAILVAVSYHGAYGVTTVLKDYISLNKLRVSLSLLVCLLMGFLAMVGVSIILPLGL